MTLYIVQLVDDAGEALKDDDGELHKEGFCSSNGTPLPIPLAGELVEAAGISWRVHFREFYYQNDNGRAIARVVLYCNEIKSE